MFSFSNTTQTSKNVADTTFKGIITDPKTAAAGGAVNNVYKKVIFKNCAPFTSCITEINNTQVDNTEDTDIVMPMYRI